LTTRRTTTKHSNLNERKGKRIHVPVLRSVRNSVSVVVPSVGSLMMPKIPKHEKRRPWKAPAKSSRPQAGRIREADSRYHTKQWQRTRLLVLQRDAACVLCMQLGKITASSVADHVIPVRMRDRADDRFYDIDTIRGLCTSCHARVSGRQAHGKA